MIAIERLSFITDIIDTINITSDGEIYRELLENELSLYSGRTESSCEIYVTSRLKADEVNIHADYYGTGKLTIKDIRLVKTTASYRMLLVMFLLGSKRAERLS
jgi:hypothetical protein